MAEPKKPNTAPPESGEKPKKEASERVTANNRAEEKLKQASKPEKEPQKKKEEPPKKKTEKQPKKETEDKKPEPAKPAKPEKKEKNWRVVRGTLAAESSDGSISTETTGIGIENKKGTTQILLGPTRTVQRAPSGQTDEQFHPIGITGRINF